MENCIFCKIANKEVSCYKIYEDDLVLAFLDINPVVSGHVLVIPKKHFENIFDIDEECLERIIMVARQISIKMKESLNVEGVNLYQANGPVAGQTVFHFHLHVLPRIPGDDLNFVKWMGKITKKLEKEEFEEIRDKLAIN
ncbi:MAG: HIT family protein [Candidatus Pacebacteria bacterium]|nr:HIT family protein [Candidatus Paceibacterota bacterium]